MSHSERTPVRLRGRIGNPDIFVDLLSSCWWIIGQDFTDLTFPPRSFPTHHSQSLDHISFDATQTKQLIRLHTVTE